MLNRIETFSALIELTFQWNVFCCKRSKQNMCYVKRQSAVEETKREEGVEECMVGSPAVLSRVIRGKK